MQSKKTILLIVFVTLLSGPLAFSQELIFDPPTDSARPKIDARRIHQEIDLDGKLDEGVWSEADRTGAFQETWPSQLKSPVYNTVVKVLYDDRNLYVGAICYNPNGRKGLRVQDMRRDFAYANSESFGVTIDPFQDIRNPIPTFLITPFATQLDQISYDDRIVDTDWDGIWRVKCSINDSSWVAEIQIPFSTLRYSANSSQWRINFSRLIRDKSQIVGWSPWPRAFSFGRTTYAGHLNNISAPANNINLRLQPYALLNATSINDESPEYKPKVGGEIKWGITPNTILEGTANTDFAQADVDRQVINLNRSSVFFPERRQFFLENASLFAVGLDGVLQPFFSRSIGRNDVGSPLKINGGARFIHQDSKKSFGALVIDQKGDTTTGGSRVGVVRSVFNLKNNSRIGAMGIVRRDEEFTGRPLNNNAVGIIDGFWRANRFFYVRPVIAMSRNSSSSQNGLAAMSEFSYTSNKVIATMTETIVNSDFESRTGFAARRDFINTAPFVLLTFPASKMHKSLIYFRPSVQGDIYHTTSTGKFQEATLSITPVSFVFQGYHRAGIAFIPAWQELSSTFQPVAGAVIRPGRYQYSRYQISYDGNLSAPYSLSFKVSTGGYYDGQLNSYFASLRIAPIPHISCILNYTRNEFKNLGENKNSFRNELIAPELRLALNANVQFSGFYQYNTAAGMGALNARFSWQYQPLSFIYVVYNDLRTLPSVMGESFQQETAIIKISYIRQI